MKTEILKNIFETVSLSGDIWTVQYKGEKFTITDYILSNIIMNCGRHTGQIKKEILDRMQPHQD